ncbi:Uncharacterised protein at_DN1626 [Pycnogonum litorale]
MAVHSYQSFSLDSPLTFNVSSVQTVDKYQLIQASDGRLLAESTQSTFDYQFTEVGLKNVLLYGFVASQGGLVGTPMQFTFSIKRPVTSIIGTNPFNMTGRIREFQEFGAKFDNVDDKTLCVEVSYGDGIVELYGERDSCKSNPHYNQFKWVDYLDPVMSFDYPYNIRGLYEVRVKVISAFGTLEAPIAIIAIDNSDCDLLEVTIHEVKNDWNSSECLYASKFNTITSSTEIRCKETREVRRKWTIYDRATDLEVKLDHMTYTHLRLPPNTLGYGQYIVSYEVEIIDIIPKMRTIKTSYICTKPNQILPKIMKGDDTHVYRSVRQPIIVLAPALYSVDPELGPGENPYFDVVILCRSLTNNEVYPVHPITLTGPIGLTKMSPITDNSTGNNGGCFGKGHGVIDFGGKDLIVFDTANFVDPSSTYEFTAVIRSYLFNSIRVSVANVKVSLIPGTRLTTYMRFLNPLKRIVRSNGDIAVNTAYNIGLFVTCTGTCVGDKDNELVFIIHEVNGAVKTRVHNSETYYEVTSASHYEMSVTLLPGLFTSHPTAKSFVLEASFQSDAGQSTSEMEINMNQPPENVACNADFYSEATPPFVRITCDNSIYDPDGDAIDSYSYYSISQINGKRKYYKKSSYPSADVLLIPDEVLDFYVDVMDVHGAFTTALAAVNYASSHKVINVTNSVEIDKIIEETISEGKIEQLPMVIEQGQALQEEDMSSLVRTVDEIQNEAPDLAITDSVANHKIETYLEASVNLGMAYSMKMQETLNFVSKLTNDSKMWASNVEKVIELVAQVKVSESVSNELIDATQVDQQVESVGNLINTFAKTEMKKSEIPDLIAAGPSLFVPSYRADFSGNSVPVDEKQQLVKEFGKKFTTFVELASSIMEDNFLKSDALESEYNQDDVQITIKKANGSELPAEIFVDPSMMFSAMNEKENGSYDVISTFTWKKMFISEGIHVYETGFEELIDEDSPTLTLQLFDKLGDNVKVNLTDEHLISVKLPRKIPFDSHLERITPTLTGNQVAQPFVVDVTDEGYFYLVVSPDENIGRLVVAMNLNKTPSFTESNKDDVRLRLSTAMNKENGNDRLRYTILISKSNYPTLFGNDSSESFLNVAIAQVKSTVDLNSVQIDTLSEADFDQNLTPFSILTATVRCTYYNAEEEKWKEDGLMLESVANNTINCVSKHMTTFGSGFFVKPNTIDFDYVFDNAEIDDNLTIYLTVAISLSLYLILLVWSRWKDRKDIEKLGASPLPDNNLSHKYLYEILAFTGTKWNAGTDSKIKFILTGDLGDSGIRKLEDTERRAFQCASVDNFVMTTPRPLGNLMHLRIWHDNGGKGKKASWYLDFIIFRDVQTGKKYKFIARQWFGVELDDGLIDRMIPVSGFHEVSEFSHLFKTTSSRRLRDGHLWLSVFLRSPRSRFSRVQRVSCCMAVLYLSMVVNIMWYGAARDKPGSGLKVGPFSLSPAQIGVGLMSNVIVFIPSLLIVVLFRKSRRHKLRPSRITEALEKQKQKKRGDHKEDDDNGAGGEELISAKVEKIRTKDSKKQKLDRKKLIFPWWCVYVAWFLTISCIVSSMFFLWAYGIQFGNEKTAKWFTSLIVSTMCSIFLTQPIKVMLSAIFLSMICKDLNYDEDDCEDDEENPELACDEAWLHTNGIKRRPRKVNMLSAIQMQGARERREKEIKMYKIIREIFVYLTFLIVLLAVSYNNRDPNLGRLRRTLHDILLKPGDLEVDYLKVTSTFCFSRLIFL